MSNTIYTIQKNDSPWLVAKKHLEATGQKVTNSTITNEMQRLAKLNDCKDINDLSAKYFNKIGQELFLDENTPQTPKQPKQTVPKDSLQAQKDSIRPLVERPDSLRVTRRDSITEKDSITHKKIQLNRKTDTFAVEAAKINNIKGDKNRIVEYNKRHGKKNYVIVDKKTCKATVYDKNGKPLKSYEVLLGATKGDDLSTAFAANPKVAAAGRRTVPGEFKLGTRGSSFGGLRALGDNMETFDPDVKLREWAPGKWGKKKFGTANQAIHGTADRKNRDKCYDNGTLSDNRQSLGCVNIPLESLNEMEKQFGITTGSSVYILPETKGNELVLTKRKDGEVKFVTKYKDQAQNVKQKKIQDAIANRNIRRNLAAAKKAEQQKLLAEQKRKEEEFSLWNPTTWFS